MMLECVYDSRKSFYGKAWTERQSTPIESIIRLFSYGTHVATIIHNMNDNTTTYEYLGKYSQTTTRHQKEFFKQNGLTDKELKDLFKNGRLEKEC